MKAESPVHCVADVHAILGEGPVWVEREAALYWVDIKGSRVFRIDEAGAFREWTPPFRVTSLAPRAAGGFIGGTEHGIAHIDLEASRFDIVADLEAHLPDNRFNDGKVDRQGRFWAGSMDDFEQQSSGTLYRLTPGADAAVIDGNYKVTNGPAFSLDGSLMFHSDTARQVTYLFDVDADGNATNRRAFLQFGEGDGYPDGMTVDAEGCLWIAFWDGWCVRRFSADGEWLQTIELPVARPTSCAFGGAALDRMYITSASVGLDQDALTMQPNAGGLFMVSPGVRGLADLPFAG